jgi:hypothetical protein
MGSNKSKFFRHNKDCVPIINHVSVKTTIDFHIGSDEGYQREMIEKLILNSGKLVEKDENSISTQLPTA